MKLEDDTQLCTCAAWEPNECCCGAWDDVDPDWWYDDEEQDDVVENEEDYEIQIP